MVPFWWNGTSKNTILNKENIGESHTVTVLENDLPPTTKRFKASHTDTVLENDLPPTAKRFQFSDECQMRELAEGLQPKNTTFEPLCGGRKIVFQYGDSVQFFASVFFIKDSIFASTIATKRAPCVNLHIP